MKQIEFKKLLEEEKDMQKIIYMHCSLKINLTLKQLDEVIKKRDAKRKREWEAD